MVLQQNRTENNFVTTQAVWGSFNSIVLQWQDRVYKRQYDNMLITKLYYFTI